MEFEKEVGVLTQIMGKLAHGANTEGNLKVSTVQQVLAEVLGEEYEERCLALEEKLLDPRFMAEVHWAANQIHTTLTGGMSSEFVRRYVLGNLAARNGVSAVKALPRFPREAPGDIPPKTKFLDDVSSAA